jgi:hypothetical protein
MTDRKYVYVRISDNVLDRSDWPILCLTLAPDGVVEEREVVNKGAYSLDGAPAEGWTRSKISSWVGWRGLEDAHPATFQRGLREDGEWTDEPGEVHAFPAKVRIEVDGDKETIFFADAQPGDDDYYIERW